MRVEVAMSWAVRPNEPSGFRGRKALLNHTSALVSALSLICQLTPEDIKQHYLPTCLSGSSVWNSLPPKMKNVQVCAWLQRRPFVRS